MSQKKMKASRPLSIEVDGERLAVQQGACFLCSPDQAESLSHSGWAIEVDGDEEPSSDAGSPADTGGGESQPSETNMDAVGLSGTIVNLLADEGILTVGDAREFLEESPEGFASIEGIGDATARKIMAAIGL